VECGGKGARGGRGRANGESFLALDCDCSIECVSAAIIRAHFELTGSEGSVRDVRQWPDERMRELWRPRERVLCILASPCTGREWRVALMP
jgi:hypothetical protein